MKLTFHRCLGSTPVTFPVHKITFRFRTGLLTKFAHTPPKQEVQTSNIVVKTVKTAIVVVKFHRSKTGNTKSAAHVVLNFGLGDERKVVFPASECGAMSFAYHYLQLAGVPDGVRYFDHYEKTTAKDVKEWGEMYGYNCT